MREALSSFDTYCLLLRVSFWLLVFPRPAFSFLRPTRTVTHSSRCLGSGTHFITENFDLAVATVDGDGSLSDVVEGVDLQVQRQTLHSLLVTEVSAEALDSDVDLLSRRQARVRQTGRGARAERTLAGPSRGFQ